MSLINKLFFIIVSITILVTYDILKNPLLFKNVNSFVEKEFNYEMKKRFDESYLNNLIGNIPYKPDDNNSMVYDIHPKDKYKQTIINGYGNCSNYVFGVSYKFIKDKKDFGVIHFFPKERWKIGGGHTVMFGSLDDELVIIDMLEGGIVSNLNQNDLFDASVSVKFKTLNIDKDDYNPYFPEIFVYDKGIMTSDEIKKYFDFLETVYVPLGNKKVEKYIYDGLAVFFGDYPKIIVSDINQIVTKSEYMRFQIYLWWFRFIAIFSIMYGLFIIFKRSKR